MNSSLRAVVANELYARLRGQRGSHRSGLLVLVELTHDPSRQDAAFRAESPDIQHGWGTRGRRQIRQEHIQSGGDPMEYAEPTSRSPRSTWPRYVRSAGARPIRELELCETIALAR